MEANNPNNVDLVQVASEVEFIAQREIKRLKEQTSLDEKEIKSLEVLNKIISEALVRRTTMLDNNPNRTTSDEDLQKDFD